MSTNFHKLKVKQIRKETQECVSVAFDVPGDLQKEFAFKQGQYLTFKNFHNNEEIRRSYSICASPLENELRVAVKKIDQGVFSSYMNDLAKVGDVLEVMKPQGRFYTEVNPTQKKLYVALAAGSGITPILSIIKTVLLTEENSRFVLIYGNKNKASIIFKEDLEALKNKYMDRFSLYNILSREVADTDILSGRIDREKCDYFLENIIDPTQINEVFLCGPEKMILSGRNALLEAGVPRENIHFELFYSAEAEQKKIENEKIIASSEDTISKVTIRLDDTALTLDLGYNGESILDAALKNGADLPYACKGGVCATCRAKVEKGQVKMDVNYSLEPDEIEAGFILTCQSHPCSEEVVVNFDIK